MEPLAQTQVDWSPAERGAWAPPQPMTVSEWAGRHRELPKAAQFPGPWNNQFGPYAVGVMNSFTDPRVERITIMASIQSIKTESAYNMLGYVICQDPGPALLVMPTLELVYKANRRLRTMMRISPELAKHLTGNPDDMRMKTFNLDRMDLNFATAGSEADLQFVEARYLLLDETDLYPPGAVKMAIDRTTTFWNRKVVDVSRPTVPDGHINREYQKSDRRQYWVPCVHCGGYQVLEFKQLKHRGEKLGQWPRELRGSEYILEKQPAVYECLHCGQEIEHQGKAGMLLAGKWKAADWPMARDGSMEPPPAVSHVGFWWSVLYSPFKNWSEVMAEFFSVKDEPDNLRNFKNQWLAEVWQEKIEVRESCSLVEGEDSLLTARPELEVPDNTVALTLGADNHKRGLAVSIWAWERLAPRVYNQHLIRYGWVDFQELERWIFDDVYYNRDGSLLYRVWRAALDTGGGSDRSGDVSLTEQAYEWLRSRGQGRVFGVKGSSGRHPGGNRMKGSSVDRMPGGKAILGGLKLWMVDTHAFKDAFWSRVEAGRVFFHGATDADFARQLTAEAREWDQTKKQWLWRQQGAQPNHYLDTTVYAAAMADPECWAGLEVLRVPRAMKKEEESGGTESGVNPFTGRSPGAWLR